MEYMGTREASKKWGIPQNAISKMCREGKIEGIEQDKKGCPWRIPTNAPKPEYKEKKKS